MTIRRLSLALPLALLAPLGAQAGTSAASPVAIDPARLVKPTFVVRGHGWGHGIGLSQWGAYGFARAGTPYARILSHYYPGTALGPAPVRKVRVLLTTGVAQVAISSEDDLRVRDATGITYDLPAARYTLKQDLKLPVDPAAKPQALKGPLLITAGVEPLALGDRTYRGGFEISVVKGKLQVINALGLEQYLYGVVPAEVPDEWPAEALKAQAVVARSYALSHLQKGAFDLYADTRSQVYLGIPEEELSTTAAVNATAGQVVLFGGKVASTYYHSTSGGRTAAVGDVWRGSAPIPYLVSVPDPYDTASPHHDWGPVALTSARLARVLKVPGAIVDVRQTVNASLRATDVVGVGVNGSGPSIDASEFRQALGLRSTWFTVGVLAIERPAKPVAFGGKLNLRAVARGLGKVTVEQRASGEAEWKPLSTIKPRSDGTIVVGVKPKMVTYFRLSTKDATSTIVKVPVAPLVKISTALDGTGLVGLVRPAVAGTVVQVQRLAGTVWRPAGSAAVSDAGRWETSMSLDAGSYRARVPAGAGLAVGTSAVLTVPPA